MNLFLIAIATICSFSDFDPYQRKLTKEQVETRIEQYLKKDDEIAKSYVMTNEALHFPDYTLYFTAEPQKVEPTLSKSFKGLKVAIDPGHLGGEYALIEERWVSITPDIRFDEGTLNLLTAKILKKRLESAGATVLLTKEKNSCAVLDKEFWTWLKERGGGDSKKDFRLYNSLDLRARAQKINDFHPDLTIIIHYNADGQRHPDTQENLPASKNFNMVFVGGSFCKGELNEPDGRYAFLRLLLTNDLEQSVQLSQEILASFTKHLQVRPVSETDQIGYLKNTSKYIKEGVYARNLVLTRLVKGPVCYGETLCQDYPEESQRLNAKDITLDGIVGPKRVEQVAEAYFEGIANFLKNSKNH